MKRGSEALEDFCEHACKVFDDTLAVLWSIDTDLTEYIANAEPEHAGVLHTVVSSLQSQSADLAHDQGPTQLALDFEGPCRAKNWLTKRTELYQH